MHFDMKNKISQLEEWVIENNVQKEKIVRVFDMLKLGKRGERIENDPAQFPACYLKDDQAKEWHDPKHYSWVKLLEENFEAIKKEALNIFNENLMDVHPENDDLSGYGTWNTFFFYKNGTKHSDNHAKCPITSSILQKILGVEIAGRTYFSAMTPGIHIKPHCGPHNFKLRTHLGIVTHQDALIRVSDTIKPWEDGQCIVFDDSFEHEVWNRSGITRIVLIVDVWNPVLTPTEIKALEFVMPEFYERKEIVKVVFFDRNSVRNYK